MNDKPPCGEGICACCLFHKQEIQMLRSLTEVQVQRLMDQGLKNLEMAKKLDELRRTLVI